MALKAGNGSISARAQRAAEDTAKRAGVPRSSVRNLFRRYRHEVAVQPHTAADDVGGFLQRHPIAALSAAMAVGVALGALLRS